MIGAAGVNVTAQAETGRVLPAGADRRSPSGLLLAAMTGPAPAAHLQGMSSMTTDESAPSAGAARGPISGDLLNMMALTFRAIDQAAEHAYSQTSALEAAAEVLMPLDRGDLLLVASLLAQLIAVDLAPVDRESLERWSQRYSFALAMRERVE